MYRIAPRLRSFATASAGWRLAWKRAVGLGLSERFGLHTRGRSSHHSGEDMSPRRGLFLLCVRFSMFGFGRRSWNCAFRAWRERLCVIFLLRTFSCEGLVRWVSGECGFLNGMAFGQHNGPQQLGVGEIVADGHPVES